MDVLGLGPVIVRTGRLSVFIPTSPTRLIYSHVAISRVSRNTAAVSLLLSIWLYLRQQIRNPAQDKAADIPDFMCSYSYYASLTQTADQHPM